jgi:hypothetical protein
MVSLVPSKPVEGVSAAVHDHGGSVEGEATAVEGSTVFQQHCDHMTRAMPAISTSA